MKFSIRDLLLVTVIVALGLGWWVHHRRHEREGWRERAGALQEAVSSEGWKVVWGQEYVWIKPPNESWRPWLLQDAWPSEVLPDPDDTSDLAAALDDLQIRQEGLARQEVHSPKRAQTSAKK